MFLQEITLDFILCLILQFAFYNVGKQFPLYSTDYLEVAIFSFQLSILEVLY